jgi:hypothetical protein
MANLWHGQIPLGGSADQIAVGQNADGRLEIFYVGTNGDLYHNWQTSADALVWAGQTRFANDSAQQIAVGQNADGRLEIFYVGTNGDLYHNWQTRATGELGSNWNQILSGDFDPKTGVCSPILGLSVIIDVTQDIVCKYSSGAMGFGFQLNAYSPMKEKSAWQQYCLILVENKIIWAVDNWPLTGDNIINEFVELVALPDQRIPKGYSLSISLQNDAQNNISGVSYQVIDNLGNTLASVSRTLIEFGGVTYADLAPIIAFELNLVGPYDSASVVLSSGAGSFTYEAFKPLTASYSEPKCAESGYITAETANSLYSPLPTAASSTLSQTFSVTGIESLIVRKHGKIRPGLIVPKGINFN